MNFGSRSPSRSLPSQSDTLHLCPPSRFPTTSSASRLCFFHSVAQLFHIFPYDHTRSEKTRRHRYDNLVFLHTRCWHDHCKITFITKVTFGTNLHRSTRLVVGAAVFPSVRQMQTVVNVAMAFYVLKRYVKST